MRFKLLMSMLIVGYATLVGCSNTVAGAGADISNAGKAIERSAK